MLLRIGLVAVAGVAIGFTAEGLAHACTFGGTATVPAYPESNFSWEHVEDFPSNGFFVSDDGNSWRSQATGETLELIEDEPLTALFARFPEFDQLETMPGPPVLRAHPDALVPGEVYLGEYPSDMLTVGPEDVTPPNQPSFEVEVVIREGGSDGEGAECPTPDTLSLRIEASDDRAPKDAIIMLAFVGREADEARTAVEPAMGFPASSIEQREQNGQDFHLVLGWGEGQTRLGGALSPAGRFCFALEAMDRAGNRSERSEPLCLNTQDREDPHVRVEDVGDCSVSPGGARAGGAFVCGLTVALLAAAVRRRRSP